MDNLHLKQYWRLASLRVPLLHIWAWAAQPVHQRSQALYQKVLLWLEYESDNQLEAAAGS